MQRIPFNVRPNLDTRLEALGFSWYKADGGYWDESAAYQFSRAEISKVESVTAELFEHCLSVIDRVIERNLFAQFGITDANVIRAIERSWQDDDPTLYGRFDFAWHGEGTPLKLLEFNADTPTSLYEASVIQWDWLNEMTHGIGEQYNFIHEAMLEQFQYFYRQRGITSMHFACARDHDEDHATTEYIRDIASQAGISTKFLTMDDIGWHEGTRSFVDLSNVRMKYVFKLYPWEWMVEEAFGKNALTCRTEFIEPLWKMLLSNKALLPMLWEMFPGHDNLLPAYFEQDKQMLINPIVGGKKGYVRKPLLSREGSNVTMRDANGELIEETSGDYGLEGHIYQEYIALPEYTNERGENRYPIIGSWVVGDTPCGLGIREGTGRITNNVSRFVPHYIK